VRWNYIKATSLEDDVGIPWAEPLRQRTQSRCIHQVRELARYWQHLGDWGKALACSRRGLEIDDPAEYFYEGVISCHYQLRDRAGAWDTCNRCKHHFAIMLSTKPTLVTDAFFRSLSSA
jgi:two-component SAPR family response regulator